MQVETAHEVARFDLDRFSELLSWEKRAGGQSGAWAGSVSDSWSGSDQGNGGAVARRVFFVGMALMRRNGSKVGGIRLRQDYGATRWSERQDLNL